MSLIYVVAVVLGALSAAAAQEHGWWLPVVAIVPAVMAVQALGAGVRLDADRLVIRGAFVERHVQRWRVVGLNFVTSLDVVVRDGRSYTTNLKQTNIRPRDTRFEVLGRAFVPDGEAALPVITEDERRRMGGPGSPDFDPEALLGERARLYRPEAWQWVLYAVFVVASVLGAL